MSNNVGQDSREEASNVTSLREFKQARHIDAGLYQPDPRSTASPPNSKRNLRPRDLIGLVMSHGARIRRQGQPRCKVTLQVYSPTGSSAVFIRM